MHHRPGNVHDSNGANDFIKSCVIRAKQYSKGATIESRTDSAFFDKKLLALQESLGVEYTNSVPFARFLELKERVEQRRKWHRLDD